uniref:Glucuronosyltransferase n=1 Tax=Caenorhabditis tropicalis TaxID=1561998 RepID=A0A1I7USN3_9PELO
MIQIGSRKFFGRHDKLEIKSIPIAKQITHYNRRELIAYFEEKRKAGRKIDEISADLAIAYSPFDFIFWLESAWKTLNIGLNIISKPGVVIVLFGLIIYCSYRTKR